MPKAPRTVKQLKELLTLHGLSTEGRKAELIERLERIIHTNDEPIDGMSAGPVTGTKRVVTAEIHVPPESLLDEIIVDNQTQDVPPIPTGGEQHEIEKQWIEFERYVCQRERELLERERRLEERERVYGRSTVTNAPVIETRGTPTDKRLFTIREISESLPEFIPMDVVNGDAARFVKRIRDLQAVFEWDGKLLLFAAQARLRAQAKIWNDNHSTVFRSFEAFAEALQSVFLPCETDTNIHIQMLDAQRLTNEGLA